MCQQNIHKKLECENRLITIKFIERTKLINVYKEILHGLYQMLFINL